MVGERCFGGPHDRALKSAQDVPVPDLHPRSGELADPWLRVAFDFTRFPFPVLRLGGS